MAREQKQNRQLADGGTLRKARKEHTCMNCKNTIGLKEQYIEYRYPIVRGGSPEYIPPDALCLTCSQVAIEELDALLTREAQSNA